MPKKPIVKKQNVRPNLFACYILQYLLLHTYLVQCNLDLVTPYLVTNLDLVTILQKTFFFNDFH